MGQADINRGKKWKEAKERTAFQMTISQATQDDLNWFDTQPAIVSDIKAYEDSLKIVEKETKSKEKK